MAQLSKRCKLLGVDVPELSAKPSSAARQKHKNDLQVKCRKRKKERVEQLQGAKWARVADEAAEEDDPALRELARRVLEVRADCPPRASAGG